MSAADVPESVGRACEVCETDNPEHARFCFACGAALRAPEVCPACSTEIPATAKFCPGCGARVVGARPAVEPVVDEERAEVAAAAQSLPAARRPPSSNIGSNVLFFVAILMVLLVVIYQMNKDAAKEVSPFEGGPPPSAAKTPAPASSDAPPSEAAPAPAAAPVRGRITLPSGETPPDGTLFIILRNAGVGRGPPLAVKKVASPTFPFEFEVGAADVMIKGMPFVGPFDVKVRLDGDGNAMTKTAGDLVASAPASNVNPGEKVDLVLDKRL